jgi:hypothetical protein
VTRDELEDLLLQIDAARRSAVRASHAAGAALSGLGRLRRRLLTIAWRDLGVDLPGKEGHDGTTST